MRLLVLVTNPEPTAHASAGAYAKEVQRRHPGTAIHLWHNRYARQSKEGFHPSNVAGNYNRFVGPEERLVPREAALLRDAAFVPEDPVLDLLRGEPDPGIHVLQCMRDGLSYAQVRLLTQAARRLGFPPRIQEEIVSYVLHHPEIEHAEGYVTGLGDHLSAMAAGAAGGEPARDPRTDPFTPADKESLAVFLGRVAESAVRRELMRVEGMLGDQIRRKAEARGPFAGRIASGHDRLMDRELGRFLVILNRAAGGSTLMRNQGVLLLFYYSLHKLFQSKTLVRVLKSLIPRRTGPRGRPVRDRFRQIRSLVEQDPQYRQRYVQAVRTLHALVIRQLAAVERALDLRGLVLRDESSRINGRAYVKLLSAFLHETIFSGLSVIVGFEYRSAAAAFQGAADRLLDSLAPAGADSRGSADGRAEPAPPVRNGSPGK
jgi:flagellar biosynthesis protein FlhG